MTQKDALRVLGVCLALGLGTVALYSPAFGFGYVNYRDPLYLLNNPHVNKGLAGAFGWAFQTGYGSVWQPLVWLSHALDCQIYGAPPGGHHATNLILHALNSMLVFLALRQLTGAFWRSAAVAAFFAWHPLHVETAAWISQRSGLLCAFFSLLALWTYASGSRSSQTGFYNVRFRYAATLVFFALALMCNSAAVAFPLLLLLLDWWPLGRMAATAERPAGKQAMLLCVEKIPFVVLSAAVCAITLTVVHGSGAQNPLTHLPFKTRLVTACVSSFHYIAASFWPSDLGPIYPVAYHRSKTELLIVVFPLVAVSIAALRTVKSRPYWMAGWLWFLVALFPLMDFLHSGVQPMSDRYMYFASIGLWMLVCWEAYDSAAQYRRGPAVVGALGVVLLAACCVASSVQLRYWRNEGSILSCIPESNYNPFGHAEYASYLLHQGQLAPAQTECEKAIAINPRFAPFPVLLGDILLAGGKTNQAVEKYQSALGLDHNLSIARLGLGRAYLAEHRAADAAGEFSAVLHDQPGHFEAHRWLAHAFMLQDKAANAVAEFHASLNLQPNQPDTLNELAWLLATDPHPEIRHGAEAVQLATRACALTMEREPRFLGTLAAAYAETGDFDKAVAAGQKAHDIASAEGRKALAQTNLQLLTLYRAHKPFREKQ